MCSYIQELHNSLIEFHIIKNPELSPKLIRVNSLPSSNFSEPEFSWIVRIQKIEYRFIHSRSHVRAQISIAPPKRPGDL